MRFLGLGPVLIVKGEPEEGMRIWADTGRTVWVDVTELPDSASRAN